jgi:MATE family multidrug resistance protein
MYQVKNEARDTLHLAIPIILGELAQMSLHIIDTAMVGVVGVHHLAAASLVMSVMNIPFVIGIGMTIAVSQMVSLAHGKGSPDKVSHYLYNGFGLCAVFAILISLGLIAGKGVLFHLGQDAEVVTLATPFLELMAWSIIPMILFMTLKQFTDGLEFTRTAMLLSIIALPINILLNWLLIFGHWGFPRLELIGAGWATLITRSIIFLVMFGVVMRHATFAPYIALKKTQWTLKWKTLKELLHIGVPSSLQIAMEAGAFSISGIIIGTISPVAQASHQIALSCASFTFMVSMGLAQGGSIRVSNAYGTHNFAKINTIGKSTIYLALIYGCLCAIGFVCFRNLLPSLFSHDEAVIQSAATLLIFAAIFQISDSTQAIGAGLLRGIKDVKLPTLFIAIAYWVLGIPFGCWLAFKFNMGAAGIWTGFIIGLTLASLFLSSRFMHLVKKQQQKFIK